MIYITGPYTGVSCYRLTVVKFKRMKEKVLQILLPLTVVKHFEFGANNYVGTKNGCKIEQLLNPNSKNRIPPCPLSFAPTKKRFVK